MTGPAKVLALELKALLSDLLYTFPDGRKAWRAVTSANALTSGEVGQGAPEKLEATFSLYPEEYSPRHEFSDSGVRGVLHYALVLKAAPGSSTWPAYELLVQTYPLLTTNAARRGRLSPQTDINFETRTIFIPQITD